MSQPHGVEPPGRLFDERVPAGAKDASEAAAPGVPRMMRPVRNQVELLPQALDDLVAADHPVRAVWAFIEQLDLTGFEAAIRAVEGGPGRSPSDPRVLLALWVYATAAGISSGRELDELTREHAAFRWIITRSTTFGRRTRTSWTPC